MALSTRSSPHAGVIEPLIKPLAQEIWKKQANLGAYEDEKLGIYQKQLGDMSSVFEQARQVRVGLQAVYAERNQHVLDLLAEVRADTDTRAKVHNDELKEYATEFGDKMEKGNKGLLAQLKHDLLAAARRYSAANKETLRLDENIQQEIKDCQEHTTAETKPIAKRLQEHSDNLEDQIVERHQHHDEFSTKLQEHFRVLRERIGVEEVARKEQYVTIHKKVDEEYAVLHSVRDVEDTSLREKCADMLKKLKAQNVDREAAQVSIVKDMMHYMDQFEKAIDEMNKAQADTTSKMEAVKKKTGFQ